MSKILIVEDSPEDLELLKSSLGHLSEQLVCCTTGQCAKEVFSPNSYSAVLLNLKLPDMDGIDLIRFIRHKSVETVIVVVTGADDPRKRGQAIEAGASGFFQKPYTMEDHRILLNQLEIRRAAFLRGKRFKHWRTTAAGTVNALGAFLWGSGVVLANIDDVHRPLVNWMIGVGVLINAVGMVYGGMVGADKKAVDDQLSK